jgi:hypothetical protein
MTIVFMCEDFGTNMCILQVKEIALQWNTLDFKVKNIYTVNLFGRFLSYSLQFLFRT